MLLIVLLIVYAFIGGEFNVYLLVCLRFAVYLLFGVCVTCGVLVSVFGISWCCWVRLVGLGYCVGWFGHRLVAVGLVCYCAFAIWVCLLVMLLVLFGLLGGGVVMIVG